MPALNSPPPAASTDRTAVLLQESRVRIYEKTDRLFARLMILQWIAGIAAALWISPRTWLGDTSAIHVHVWAAIFLGGVITSLPVFLAWKQPGRVLSRHVIAVAQMLFSGLLIHLSGGRIETHFHVFGSLAFLAFYRDWRVLLTATVVTAADHILRGSLWPQSIFGVFTPTNWRWIEHAAWVVFEDIFLLISIRLSNREMVEVAQRSELETAAQKLAQDVSEARRAELELRLANEALAKEIVDRRRTEHLLRMAGRIGRLGAWAVEVPGYAQTWSDEVCALYDTPPGTALSVEAAMASYTPESSELLTRAFETCVREGTPYEVEVEMVKPDGRRVWMRTIGEAERDGAGAICRVQGALQDISESKRAKAALHKSEARYRSLFEHMLEGYVYCPLEYRDGAAVDSPTWRSTAPSKGSRG